VPGEAFPDHLMDSEPVFPAYRKDPVLSGDDDCTGSGGAAVKTELVTSPACFDPVCKKVAFGSEEVFVFDPSAPAFVPAVDNGPDLAEGSKAAEEEPTKEPNEVAEDTRELNKAAEGPTKEPNKAAEGFWPGGLPRFRTCGDKSCTCAKVEAWGSAEGGLVFDFDMLAAVLAPRSECKKLSIREGNHSFSFITQAEHDREAHDEASAPWVLPRLEAGRQGEEEGGEGDQGAALQIALKSTLSNLSSLEGRLAALEARGLGCSTASTFSSPAREQLEEPTGSSSFEDVDFTLEELEELKGLGFGSFDEFEDFMANGNTQVEYDRENYEAREGIGASGTTSTSSRVSRRRRRRGP